MGYLEHVVVQISTTFVGIDADYYIDNVYYELFSDYYYYSTYYSDQYMPNRGDIQIELTSPQGTMSILLPYREKDSWPGDYNNWPFMSVHFWGEDPSGDWTLSVIYRGSSGRLLVSDVEFTFYGTTSIPAVISRIPAQCDDACARGCAAAGAEFCDACRLFRDAETLECVDSCANGLIERSRYCYNASKAEDLTTCGGFGEEEPDTEEPDTEEPDTEEPDTEEPDTEEPDTEEPDTEEPDTEEPDTEEPDTEEPDTDEPDTEEPDTEEPDTEEPDTEEPDTEEPPGSRSEYVLRARV